MKNRILLWTVLAAIFSMISPQYLLAEVLSVPRGAVRKQVRVGGRTLGCVRQGPTVFSGIVVRKTRRSLKVDTNAGRLRRRLAATLSRLRAQRGRRAGETRAARSALRTFERFVARCVGSEPPPLPSPTAPPEPTPIELENDECINNRDDDGDGLIDFDDSGCFGPNGQESARDYGFTQFELSADTRVIYVSATEGSDDNSGLSSDNPVRTLGRGASLLRPGYPDWLLLRRGDQWVDEAFTNLPSRLSGRSETDPLLIASYGRSRARPRILVPRNASGIKVSPRAFDGERLDHLVIAGLHIVGHRNVGSESNEGIKLQGPGRNILIEDCRIERFGVNINIGGAGSSYIMGGGVRIRRNVLHDSWSFATHSQNIYTHDIEGLVVEENVVDRGGWSAEFPAHHTLTVPNGDMARWSQVRDGSLGFRIDELDPDPGQSSQQHVLVTGIDFAGVRSLNEIAARLEAAMNAAVLRYRATPDPALEVRVWQEPRSGENLLLFRSLLVDEDARLGPFSAAASGTSLSHPELLGVTGSALGTIFNHNMYIYHAAAGEGAIVRNNIISRASSHGVQIRVAPQALGGGRIDNNLFVRNSIAGFVGGGEGIESTMRRNVVLQPQDNIARAVRGMGLQAIGTWSCLVEENVVAHAAQAGGFAFALTNFRGSADEPGPADLISRFNATLRNNIVYKWGGPALHITGTDAALYNDIRFLANLAQQPLSGLLMKSAFDTLPSSRFLFDGNRYYSSAPSDRQFNIWNTATNNNRDVDYSVWAASAGEGPLSGIEEIAFPDPERTIESYEASLGLAPTFDDFIAHAKAQSKFSWDPNFTSAAVNRYVRKGFNLTEGG